MEYTVERTFYDLKHTCLGWAYPNFDDVLKDLIYEMRDKIGHPFIGDQFYNLRFVMNPPFYHEFYRACQMSRHDADMCRGIKISPDQSLYIGDTKSPTGKVKLIYEEPEIKTNRDLYGYSFQKVIYDEFIGLDRGNGFKRVPHIDHVKFNGPATIVFWKDGTKTVVKYDGEGFKDYRKAILYAFIRKIYGEGRPYHDILNEIENVIEQELWMPLPEKEDIK